MKTEIFNLAHGGKVLFQRHKEIRGISVKFYFTAGAFNDKKGKLGTAHFCEHAFFGFPSARMTREEKAAHLKKFEYLNAYTSGSDMSFVANVTADDFEELIDYITEQFSTLQFIQEEFDKEKKIIEDEIKTMQKSNSRLYSSVYRTELIKDPHFNNMISSPAGTVETLNKITLKDVIEFKNNYISLNNLIVSVCGNISKSRVKKAMKTYVEPRLNRSDVQGFMSRTVNEVYAPKFHFAKSVEKGKAMLVCNYNLKHIPWTYDTPREHIIGGILSQILQEKASMFYRQQKNLCYGCSLYTMSNANHYACEFYIECQEENLSQVIELYDEFLKFLPGDLDEADFEKHKKTRCNRYNFDYIGIGEICDAMHSTFINENKKYDDAFRKKVYEERKSVTYSETNDLYKTLFKAKPHVTIISNDENYKDFDYKTFIKKAIK